MHRLQQLHEHNREDVRQHFLALTQEDRELRFGQPKPNHCIHHYVDSLDFDKHPVYGIFVPKKGLIAVLEVTPCHNDTTAEIAMTVRPAWRRLGLGTRLFARALLLIKEMGRKTAVFQFLTINTAVRKIASRHGAQMWVESGEVNAEVAV